MRLVHQKPRPSSPVAYPSGVFVETEKGYFYINSATTRFRVPTKRVLRSWSTDRIVWSSEAACAKFRIVAKLKFRNGSLLHDVSSGKMYFISEGKRRHLVAPEAWEKIGAVDSKVKPLRVSLDEINLHEEGEPLA